MSVDLGLEESAEKVEYSVGGSGHVSLVIDLVNETTYAWVCNGAMPERGEAD